LRPTPSGIEAQARANDDFLSMHRLAREFKENGWGLKVPFAHDSGGWHFCLSFDAKRW
jgi:hypothetical protein